MSDRHQETGVRYLLAVERCRFGDVMAMIAGAENKTNCMVPDLSRENGGRIGADLVETAQAFKDVPDAELTL